MTNIEKRVLSFLLALVMLVGMVPQIPLTADAAEKTISGHSVKGLTATWENKTGDGYGSGNGSGKNITVTATGYTEGSGCNASDKTSETTLILTNNLDSEAKLKFTYTLSAGSVSGIENGSYEGVLAKGASLTITQTSPSGADQTGELILKDISLVSTGAGDITTTFALAEGGSYTINGEAVTSKTEKSEAAGTEYTLEATAESGYAFQYWYNVATNEIYSFDAIYNYTTSENATIAPKFASEAVAVYGVGTAKFEDLNIAAIYASTANTRVVTLLADATLPKGNYTIPAGVTLLIPWDAANTVYGENPKSNLLVANLNISAFRTLTLANGAELVINGTMEVSGQNASGDGSGQAWAGSPMGPLGFVNLNEGSTITVNSGGKLFAWGYIHGDGEVIANSGAKVYEMMQVTDFRGGRATVDMSLAYPILGIVGGKKDVVFPFSQYYVQNIESRLTLNYGASEYALAVIQMENEPFPTLVEFIGPGNCMFKMKDGYIVKTYHAAEDRLVIDAYGGIGVTSISLSFTYMNFPIPVNSGTYNLPINSNITINMHKGTSDISQDVALLPGAKITIGEEAVVNIPKDNEMYVYDYDSWKLGLFVHSAFEARPLAYTVGKRNNYVVNSRTLSDAVVDVNGTVNVSGKLYTTGPGASITSSKGTGRINLLGAPDDNENATTKQATYNGSINYTLIPMTAAKLQNGDESYTETLRAKAGSSFGYHKILDKWVQMTNVPVTYDFNDGSGTTEVKTVDGEDLLDGFNLWGTKEDTDFFTRDGYRLDGWNEAANGTGRNYTLGQFVPALDNPDTTENEATDEFLSAKTLYAVWTKLCSIIFKSGDEEILKRNAESGETVTIETEPTAPAVEGKTFAGWVDMNGTLVEFPLNVTIDADTPEEVIFTPLWVNPSATVTYQDKDGTTIDTQSGNYNTAITVPDVPEVEGHTFAGWVQVVDGTAGTETVTAPTKVPGEDMVLRATYTVNTYTFTYDANGGTAPGGVSLTTEYQFGEKLATTHPNITRAGYVRTWEITGSESGVMDALPSTMPAENITMKAVWTPRTDTKYAVEVYEMQVDGTYNVIATRRDTLTGTTDTTATVDYTGDFAVPTGFTADTTNANNVTSGNIAGDGSLVLKLYYSRNQYTLYTKADENATPEEAGKYYYGESVTNLSTPTKAGYSFTGWNGLGDTMPNSNLTVTANWIPKTDTAYKVETWVMDTNGEYVLESTEDKTGTTDNTANATHSTRTGFTRNTALSVTSGNIAGDGSLVLKLYYDRNQWTFTVDVDGVETKTTYYYDQEIEVPEDPSKEGAGFTGWYPTIPGKMPNNDLTVTALWSTEKYTISFNNWDGSLLQTVEVTYGKTPVCTVTPTRAGDAQYRYDFKGWNPTVVPATESTVYTADYTQITNKYAITFLDEDKTKELAKINVEYGTVPVYPNDTPTKAEDDEYTYEFSGWNPELSEVKGEATYVATYKPTPKSFTITFVNYDGTLLEEYEVAYGAKPNYDGDEPARAKDAQYTYTFAGWDTEIVEATENKTYKAMYSTTTNTYTVIWQNHDGTELEKDENVPYGETPEFNQADPTREQTAQYTFTFDGWDLLDADGNGNEVKEETFKVEGNQTYKALYSAETRMYTVIYLDEAGNTIARRTNVPYGTDPKITVADQVKKDTAEFDYEFIGWDLVGDDEEAAVTEFIVTGDMTYVPLFSQTRRSYTVTWIVNGEETEETYVYGATPEHEDPTKPADEKNTYRFKEWEPAISTVTGDVTYTAVFNEILNRYTITWDVGGVKTEEAYEYGSIPSREEPTKESNETTDFAFSYWSPEIKAVTADQTYTAVFTESARKYTVTWNVDGKKTVVQVANGETITEHADHEKEHYIFKGWEPEIPAQMPTSDIEFTATWTPVKYTVQWDIDGDGNVDKEEDLDYGADMPAVTGSKITDDKYSYEFTNWYPAVTDMVEGNVTYTAQFNNIPVPYTITFNADGGNEVQRITQGYGTDITALPETTKDGYDFVGWYNGQNKVEASEESPLKMPVGGMELTAKWTAIKYTIYFEENSGTPVDDITEDYLTAITALPTTTRTGYDFAGWYNGQNKVEASDESPLIMPLDGMTLTAKWTPITYKLIYHANDGVTTETQTQDVTYDAPAELDMNAFSRDGYTFLGWDTVANATEPAYKTAEYTHTVAGDLNLYAIWKINQYTITFDEAEGSDVEDITADYQAAISKPADPKKEGHSFAGWDANNDKQADEFPGNMPLGGMKLTALWTVNSYSVKFMDVDTDGNQSEYGTGETLEYGSVIPMPADPKDKATIYYEYTFEGWDADGDGEVDENLTVAAHDMTIVAIYSQKGVPYTIYWDLNGDSTPDKIEQVPYGEPIVEPEAEEKTGYTAVGWSYAGGEIPETMPARSLMFVAEYEINQYTITFETDGGTEIEKLSVTYGGTIGMPENPKKENHTFSGWEIKGESGKVYGEIPETMPAENLIFTAKWLVNQATFVFYSEDKIYHSYEVKTGDTAEDILPENSPAKDGYEFQHWSETKDGDAIDFSTLDLSVGKVLYAVWKANNFTITINENGGDEVDNIVEPYESLVKLPTMTRAGYDFVGWEGIEGNTVTMPLNGMEVKALWSAQAKEYVVETYIMGTDGKYPETATSSETKSSFTDKEVTASHAADMTGFTADIDSSTLSDKIPAVGTLALKLYYARNQYKFTTDVDGEKNETIYYYGAAVADPATPIREGHSFTGWSPEVPETMPATDVDVIAQWDVNEHTVTWKAEGRKISQDTYKYGDTIMPSMKPAKEGYTFDGWFDENDEAVTFPVAMGDTERIFNAKFTINRYSVTWMADDTEVGKETYEYGAKVEAPADPEKTGYKFTGWDTTLETMPAEDVIINALFELQQYTITFDSDGGSAVKAVTQDYDTFVEEPAEPVKEGNTFNGWSYENGDKVTFPVAVTAENITLKASWIEKEYTITWIVDGTKTVENAVFGTPVKDYAPADPKKEGYTFTGWGEELDDMTMPAKNLTFVAEWTINTHTVTWNVDDEKTVVDYVYGKSITKPVTPKKEGYTFIGWGAEVPATMPNEDLVFTAQWSKNSHTVTWIVDGVKTVDTYEYGAKIIQPEKPTKEGYSFTRWTPEVEATMPDRDLVYTAQWTADSFNLTWKVDEEDDMIRCAYGTAIAKKADPSKPGHTFIGWAKDSAPETVITVPATMPAEDLTLVAVWSVNKYTVTWNVDGQLTTETYAFGDPVTAPVKPEKEGYAFEGWSPTVTTMGDANVTYTATWTKKEYTITWDLDNGTDTTQTTVAYEDVITAEVPVWEGHTFIGWTVTGKESTYETAPKKMPAEDLTYTANWEVSSYTVTWNVDGKLTRETYAYGAAITAPADLEKSGYVFDTWDPAVPATMPAENMTFTAKWNKDKFTVTWIVDGAKTPVTYEYGAAIVRIPNPAKEGYTFAGWEVTSGSTNYIPNTMPAENLEITARWTQNKYTVTWNVDGKTTVQSYLYGETITAPADPAKEGHTFKGWKDAEGNGPEATMSEGNKTYFADWTAETYTLTWIVDGITTSKDYSYGDAIELYTPTKAYHTFTGWDAKVPATMPAEDLSFTAQWDPDDYTITFHANNGTDDKTEQTVEYNVAEALDANPFTYEGYGFKGWATDKDSTETPYKNGDTVRVTDDMNLYAVWEEGQYTITWNVDGEESTSSCKYGTNIVLPTVPKKPGHTFDGWLDEAGKPVTASTKMPARDMVVTASWKVIYYDITWDTDGDGDVDDTTSVAYGEMPVHAEGSRASVPQYDYTFIRWEPELAAVTGEAAYKAKFEAVDRYYDVTFVTNVDGITVDPVNVKYGDSVTLQTLRREGYTFKGWSTNPVSSEGVNDTYTVTGETTLYAIWSANVYQLSFVNEFGLTMTYRQYYGTAVELPEEPVQEGYTFQGWINQKDASAGIPETVPAEHLTFVADWQINQYSITFANTGDTAMEPIIQDYGTVIMAPADPVRVGYTFKGWDKEIPATMPAEDMTITAKWERNVYTIRWDINGDGTVDVLEEEYTEELEHGKMPTVQTGRKAPDKQYTYIFDGWAPEVTEATSDQVYTAQFTTTTNEYKISWDYDGDGNVDDAAMVAYGVMPNHSDVTKKSDEKYIYTFTGWYPELAEVTGEALYTAQYDTTGVKYTVNFLLDQNGGIVKSITAGYGTPIEVPENPTKPGYTFVDWDKEIPETMPVYGATITARWSINTYTITFDSDGGTDVASITTRFEGPVTAPAAPTRTGYTFAGWLPAVPATMPAENMTLTAQWTPNQYTITFGSNGGSQVEAITQAYGSAVTAPADPVREGYTFAGWDQDVPATMPAENITLTAKWTPNAYDVRFYTDDSMTELHATVSADCDAGFQLPAEPTRAGYNFGGWFWVDQEGNEVAIPTIMIAGGMDVYAKWNVGTFTIQFNTDGGSVVESITAEYGAEITAPADPEKEGYSFVGWDAAFPATMPAESMTLNAVWKINQYTIRFNTDGGSEIASITQDYNTAVTAPAENPTKAGYTFAGWDAVIPTVMPARNVTINARWAANRYTITFNTNGGTPIESITADFGAALTEPAAPVKTGYVFAGWDVEFPATMPVDGLTLNAQWAVVEYAINWDTDGDGTVDDTTNVAYDTMPVHADGARPAIAEYTYVFSSWDPKISVVRGTATYTALFDIVPNEYTITFDTNGGSEIAPVTYAYGTAVAEPAAPTKEGYTFAGWDALPGTMPAKNVKVVAQWKVVDYTITFDTAGGTAVAPITAGYNTTIAAPNDPTREGYTFAGWTPAFPETMPLNGMTLTATWKINQYTIRFNSDGGTEVASITQDYGTAVTAPAAPTKEGYTFQGWNAEIPATMPARDMTFTALWKYTYSGWLTDDIGTTYLKNGEKAYYAQWANIGGKDYYFDSEGYIVKGLYQTWSMDDDYEATFLFDEETGVFCKDVTTVYDWNEKLYYVENGEVINYPGLVRIVREDGEINYYYFGSDNEAVKDGTYTVTQNNDLLPVDPYIFGADGVIEHHEDTSRNGIHEEDGKKYYYIDGVKVHMGLVEVDGEYYYASNGGELICGRTYWITRTNDLLPEMAYTFDEEGKIVFETEEPEEPEDPTDPTDPEEPTEPEEPVKPVKNGIYAEDGSLFYYENDQRTYGGLMEIGGYYYYAKINGEIIHGRSYWVTKTNDLMAEGSYAFDDQGRMILAEEPDDSDPSDPTEPEEPTEPLKNGIYAEDGSLYYYEDGERTYAGLIEIDGYYYYVRTSAEVVHGRSYWITKTNGILPEKSYTFDDQGRMIDVTPDEKDTGKNGIYAEDGSLYYYENGLRTYGGLMEIDGYYYYAKTNGEVVNGRKYWITKTNDLMPETSYYFDSQGRMIIQEDPSEPLKNGIYAEDGSLYYYENGERTYAGVIILDGYYYYVKTNCEVVHGCKYWISKTNGLIPEMSYTFDDQGRIQDTRPENDDQQKNGIYKENGTLYYYVDGHKAYAGLIQIDGEYYYAKSDGAIVCGRKYWITRTNGIMEEGYYTFDADGRMVL